MRKIRDTGQTQCLTLRAPPFTRRQWDVAARELLQWDAESVHRAGSQRANKPTSINAFCFVSVRGKLQLRLCCHGSPEKNRARQLSHETGCSLTQGVGQQMLLRCTSTAVQLLALHFRNIQNSVRPSWVLPSPVYTTLRCGRCRVF